MKIITGRIYTAARCLRDSVLTGPSVFLMIVLLTTGLSTSHDTREGSWSDLRWLKSNSRTASREAMISNAEDIIKIFKTASVFNPPKGMRIVPVGEFHKSINLPENQPGPKPFSLELGIRIPPEAPRSTAFINIWINDPLFLLGDPVLSDKQGEIFMLPPLTGKLAEQTIRSRTAHPSGYEEKYPSESMFPLWAHDQEPFLRTVVRPTFKLAKGTAVTVITSGEKPFWKPVSQERWIMAMIEMAKGELADFRSGIAAAQQSDITGQQIDQMKSYLKRIRALFGEKEIIERHASTIEQAMNIYIMMKETNPEEAEKYYLKTIHGSDESLQQQLDQAEESRAELEEYEDKLINALVTVGDVWTDAGLSVERGDWDALERAGREHDTEKLVYLADAGRAIHKLEAELNSLSAAQRKAPAYGFELPPWNPMGTHKTVVAMTFEAERPSGLVDQQSKGARALVSLDPDFFDFDEASIGIMGIEWSGYHKLSNPAGDGTMPEAIWSSLNWQALRAFVD